MVVSSNIQACNESYHYMPVPYAYPHKDIQNGVSSSAFAIEAQNAPAATSTCYDGLRALPLLEILEND